MTIKNEEMEEGTNVKIVPATSVNFERKNDLAKVMRKIDKSVDKAIEFLEQVMLDENVENKQRVEAAKFIIDRKIQISTEVSRDQLSRAIATSRLMLAEAATQQKRIKNIGNDEEDDEESGRPVYMPSVILDHSTIKEM